MKINRLNNILTLILLAAFASACQDSPQKTDTNSSEAEVPAATTSTENDLLGWQSFVSNDYQLAMQYPEDWMLIENNNLPNDKAVINIFPTGETVDSSTYSETHGDSGFSYLAIYPRGLERDFPWGQSMTFAETQVELPAMTFPINQQTSRILQLEDGKVWGYYIQPQTMPETWSADGFLFVQYSLENFQANCVNEKGKAKSLSDCNTAAGDRMVRSGTVNTKEAYLLVNILEEIELGGLSS